MAKIVVISDSFKGAVTSTGAHTAIAAGVRRGLPDARLIEIPVADGGEGTVEAMLAATGGTPAHAEVCGVFPGESVTAEYGLIGDATAVVEMAACAGLPLAAGSENAVDAQLQRLYAQLAESGLPAARSLIVEDALPAGFKLNPKKEITLESETWGIKPGTKISANSNVVAF